MESSVPVSHVPEAKHLAKMKVSWNVSVTMEQIHANAVKVKELSAMFLLFHLGFGYK